MIVTRSSAGAVSGHTGAMRAVVDVGAELNHPNQRFAAAATTADDRRGHEAAAS